MSRSHYLLLSVVAIWVGVAGSCSRARVESMNKMNEGVIAEQDERGRNRCSAEASAGCDEVA